MTSASERDSIIRILDLDSEENYILTAGENEQGPPPKISSLAWSDKSGMLAAGTKEGAVNPLPLLMFHLEGLERHGTLAAGNTYLRPWLLDCVGRALMSLLPGQVCFFKYVGDKDGDGLEDRDVYHEEAWEQMPMVDAGGHRCAVLEWGPNPRVLSVSTEESLIVLKRTLLAARLRDSVAAVQLAQDKVRSPESQGAFHLPSCLPVGRRGVAVGTELANAFRPAQSPPHGQGV